MANPIDWSIKSARTVLMILVLLMFMGFGAYTSIPRESTPDVRIPMLIISLNHEGISPEDAERLLIRPVEQKVQSIEGVKEMSSTARLGGGVVLLKFHAGLDVEKAKADVRDKIDEVKPDLPDESDEPVLQEINLSHFPVLVVSMSGQIPQRTLYRMARELQDEIEAEVSEVLEVNIVGEQEEAVEIVIDPIKLEGYGFSIEDVLFFVTRNNRLISAGNIDTGTGRMAIKVPGLIQSAQDLFDLPLKVQGDAVVKFSDVASVRRTFKDREGYAREMGQPAVALEVVKRTGENIIDTVAAARKITEEVRQEWPDHLHITYSQDESDKIIDMVGDLQNSLIIAILLVMVVIMTSLGGRSALLVGVAVPGSFLIGTLVLQWLGLTMNIVVLFSLILAVGMLVDGAIIVVEYADRKMAEGLDRVQAFSQGAKRMTWPVISSISTILAVFMPLLFWPGVVGQFMKFMPITLLATLTASMLMALIFIPTLGAIFGKASEQNIEERKSIAASEVGDLKDVKGHTQTYIQILERALEHPWKIMLGTVVLLIAILFIYATFGRGVEFFPNVEPNTSAIEVHARGNLSVEERDALVKRVEDRILDLPYFTSVYTNTEVSSRSRRKGPPRGEDVIGAITVEYIDWQKRPTADEISEIILERVSDIPGIIVAIRKNKPGPPTDKPIEVELSSNNIELLETSSKKVKRFLEALDGVTAVEDNASLPGIDWQINVDRAQAAKFGADVSLIGGTIRLVTNGIKIDEFRPDDSKDEIDILVRFPEDYRTLEQLKRIRIQTKQGLVPISSFVTMQPKPKINVIRRINAKRALKVSADVLPSVTADEKITEIRQWLETEADFDPKLISVQFKGEEEDKKETGDFLAKAFMVALFIIAIILVTQFNSFFSMGLVLSSIVMSTIGVFIGLLVMNQRFGIVMGGLGIIALAGIIVSNNIIMIDTFDRLRERIKDAKEVILRTGAQRLRPVILTQITTILGLTPIMLGINIDFLGAEITYGAPSTQWWRQLSTAIVFGVFFASVLTLIVTPCALMARENFRARRKSL
ncbi:MAG: efflux RND transporter permease subunit [Alphaproteobacteria bacterium]